MATEFSEINLSLTGNQANTLIFEPVFMENDIRSLFKIISNARHKQKIPFVGDAEKIIRQYAGCGFNPVGGFDIYGRCIDLEHVKVDLEQCWDEVECTLFEDALNSGTRISEIDNTILNDILIKKMKDAIARDIMRLFFFGNKASSDPAYSIIDGLWSVHIPALVSANLIPHVNGMSGTAITPTDAYNIIKGLVNNADIRLKGLPVNMKYILVSGSLYDKFKEYLTNLGGCCQSDLVINGIPGVKFEGIDIIPMWSWDSVLTGDLGVTLPNYALYTAKANLILATDIVSPAEDFKQWYDDKTEHLYTKARWKMGANYVHPSLMSVAY